MEGHSHEQPALQQFQRAGHSTENWSFTVVQLHGGIPPSTSQPDGLCLGGNTPDMLFRWDKFGQVEIQAE